jgi:hypothetical protein
MLAEGVTLAVLKNGARGSLIAHAGEVLAITPKGNGRRLSIPPAPGICMQRGFCMAWSIACPLCNVVNWVPFAVMKCVR